MNASFSSLKSKVLRALEEDAVYYLLLIFFSKDIDYFSIRLFLFSLIRSSSSSPLLLSMLRFHFFYKSLELGYLLIPSSSFRIMLRDWACSLKLSIKISSRSQRAKFLFNRSFMYFSTLFLMKGLLMMSIIVGLFCGFLESIEVIRSRSCLE